MRISASLRASLPERLSALERALAESDAPGLRETAHQLGGLVSPFSSVAGQLASELEEQAARGDLEVSTLVEKLSALAPDLMREVDGLSLDALRTRAG